MAFQSDPEGTEAKYLRQLADFNRRRVLELGCGDGRLTWRYAGAAARVSGIDLEANDLRAALIERPANLANAVHFVRADAIHLPFASQSFDLALFAWSF